MNENPAEKTSVPCVGIGNDLNSAFQRLGYLATIGTEPTILVGRADLKKVLDGLEEAEARHSQLLLAVARKHPGETRHETALRYIREREEQALAGRSAQESKQEPSS